MSTCQPVELQGTGAKFRPRHTASCIRLQERGQLYSWGPALGIIALKPNNKFHTPTSQLGSPLFPLRGCEMAGLGLELRSPSEAPPPVWGWEHAKPGNGQWEAVEGRRLTPLELDQEDISRREAQGPAGLTACACQGFSRKSWLLF